MSIIRKTKMFRKQYPTRQQKNLLIKLINADAELKTGKFNQNFTLKDAQTRWKAIADELNTLKGAKKEWQAWRKTWQDMRAKAKKRHNQMVLEEKLNIDGSTSPVGIIVEEDAFTDHNGSQEVPVDYLPLSHIYTSIHGEPCNEDNDSDAPEESPDSPGRVTAEPALGSHRKKRKHVLAQKKLQQAIYTSTVISEGLKQKNSIKLQLLKMKKQFYTQYIEEMRRQTDALRDIAHSIASSSRTDM